MLPAVLAPPSSIVLVTVKPANSKLLLNSADRLSPATIGSSVTRFDEGLTLVAPPLPV